MVNRFLKRIIAGPLKGLYFCAPSGPAGYFWGNACQSEIEIFAKNLKPGKIFLDIGAQVGYLSLVASKFVGESGKVYAFEPYIENFNALKQNISQNRIFNIFPLNIALSEESGAVFLELKADTTRTAITNGVTGLKINSNTLDNLIAEENLPAPDFVKIDVEGAEMKVLSGMLQTIDNSRPNILVEIHRLGKPFNDFVRTLSDKFNYHYERVDGKLITAERERYLLFLTPD